MVSGTEARPYVVPPGRGACGFTGDPVGGTLVGSTGAWRFSASDTPSYSGVFCESCLPTSPSSVHGVRLRGDYKHPAHRCARILGPVHAPALLAPPCRVRLRG